MKKILALGIIGILWGTMIVGADDAKVMPARVGRFYVAPTYAFASGAYNKDGEYKDYPDGGGAPKFFNLGFALEYGVIDWVTAAIQWAPGWNVWSDVDMTLPGKPSVNANGVADIFAGAKLQIIGEKAPVQNSQFRLAFAPGVKIPLPGPDFEEEAKKVGKADEKVTPVNVDKHVLGVGTRVYFDYIINENFFINLYSEFIWFPIKGELEKAGLEGYGAAQTIKSFNGGPGAAVYGKIDSDGVDYGYDLTFEVEPVFSMPLAQGISFTAGLPVNYKMTPGVKYGVDYTAAQRTALSGSGQAQFIADGDPTGILTVKPNVSVFLTGLPLPTEFKVQYSLPVWGKLERATHSITLQAKLYFRI